MLDLQTAKHIFDTLYSDINGYTVSAQARNKIAYHDKAHTYGEVVPESFHTILKKTNPKKGEVFYDLGSGTGKAAVLAHLLFDFSKAVGVEFLKELHDTAETVRVRYEKEHKHVDTSTEKELHFHNRDFLRFDFSDADVIFTHSTCFYDELWDGLLRRFQTLKPGSRIVTVTKTIHSPGFVLIGSGEHGMGWGKATVFVYEKT